MARFGLGPWVWDAAERCWRMPAWAAGGIDLRNRTACGTAGGSPQGVGLFVAASAATLGSDYADLGTDPDAVLSGARKSAVRTLLRLPRALAGNTLKAALYEALTLQADPANEDRCPPIMPTTGRDLEVWLAGERVFARRFRADLDEAAPVRELLRRQYRALRQDSLDGKSPRQHYRKVLGDWVRKYGLPARWFQPDDLPEETDLPPETTLSDDFNRADSATLGTASGGGTWSEPVGNIDIASNRALGTTAAGPAYARLDSVLSSADHYCELLFVKVTGDTSTSRGLGPAARYHSILNTFYTARQENGSGTGVFRIYKVEDDIPTVLGSGVSGVTCEAVKRMVCDGSTLESWSGGVLQESITDSSITGNTRCGIYMASPDSVLAADDWAAADFAIPLSGSDTLSLADAGSLTVSGSDTLAVADTGALAATLPGADTLSLADDGTAAATLSASDTLALADAAGDVGVAGSDALAATDGAVPSGGIVGADTLSVADAGVVSPTLPGSADTLSLADAAALIAVTGSDVASLAEDFAIAATLAATADAASVADDSLFGLDGSDTLAVADAGSLALTDADEVFAADAPVIAATISGDDAALLTEMIDLFVPPDDTYFEQADYLFLELELATVGPLGSDTAAVAEASLVSLSADDSITLADAGSLGSATVEVVAADTLTLAEASLIAFTWTDTLSLSSETALPGPLGAEPVSVAETNLVGPLASDTLAANDAGSVSATLAGSDTLTLAEGTTALLLAFSSSDTLSLADTGQIGLSGAETLSVADAGALNVLGTDTVGGSDGSTPGDAARTATDTITLADAAASNAFGHADTLSLADTGYIGLTGADTLTGTDAATLIAFARSDTLTLTDGASTPSTTNAPVDTANLADMGFLTVLVVGTDTLSLADTGRIGLTGADTLTLVDAAAFIAFARSDVLSLSAEAGAVAATLSSADTLGVADGVGTGAQAQTAADTLSIADAGQLAFAGADTLAVADAAVRIGLVGDDAASFTEATSRSDNVAGAEAASVAEAYSLVVFGSDTLTLEETEPAATSGTGYWQAYYWCEPYWAQPYWPRPDAVPGGSAPVALTATDTAEISEGSINDDGTPVLKIFASDTIGITEGSVLNVLGADTILVEEAVLGVQAVFLLRGRHPARLELVGRYADGDLIGTFHATAPLTGRSPPGA